MSHRRKPHRQVVRRASQTIRRSAERAVGQYAGPASIQTLRRSDICRTGPIRASGRAVRRARLNPNLSPKRYLPNRTDTSEPSGSTQGPSRSAPSAEAPRVSRRAVRRARLDRTIRRKQHTGEPPGPSRPNDPAKRYERAVGSTPGPSGSEPSAVAPRASRWAGRRACVEPSAEALHASRRARCRA